MYRTLAAGFAVFALNACSGPQEPQETHEVETFSQDETPTFSAPESIAGPGNPRPMPQISGPDVSPELIEILAETLDEREPDVVGIMDLHYDMTPHNFLAELMPTLSDKGYKDIGLEGFSVAEERLSQAFANGEISEENIELIAHHFLIAGDSGIGAGADPLETTQALAYIVSQAKEEGVRLHAINHFEGLVNNEEFEIISNFEKEYLEVFLKEMQTSEFNELEPYEKEIRIEEILIEFTENNPEKLEKAVDVFDQAFNAFNQSAELREILINEIMAQTKAVNDIQRESFRNSYESQPISLLLSRLMKRQPERLHEIMKEHSVIGKRNALDPVVAERMSTKSQGEKMVLIYGGVHFARHGNDLDDTFEAQGLTTLTIRPYYEGSRAEQLYILGMTELTNHIGYDLSDHADIEVDLENGVLQLKDGTTISYLPSVPDEDSKILSTEPY